jgi:putative hydrolase of the HAD superfamily
MSGFDHIETWVFDLDNTLYPASCRLFDQIDVKMGEFVSRALGMTYADAKKRQKELFYKHGTTLRGLMQEHDMKPEGFLDYVHDIDYASVKSDTALQSALEKLPGRKFVFTNGTVKHARAVTERLGVSPLFDAVFDIIDANYVPKPARAPYDSFLASFGVLANKAAMFEDIVDNLEVPHHLGMTTVLVTSPENDDANHLNRNGAGPHVHHVTGDLAAFLHSIHRGKPT